MRTYRKFDVLVVQNNDKGKTKKRAACANLFCANSGRRSVLQVQFVFLLIRSISLEAIFIVVPF